MKITHTVLIRRLRSNEFLRHNAIFFTGSLAVSILNYLYYPVLGRLLPATQFGEVQALVSLFLQATIFLGVVTNVAVNVVANEPDAGLRSRIVGELERVATLVVVAGLLVCLAFLPWIQAFLQFNEPLPFIILGVSLAITAPLSLRSAYLRGMSAFARLSVAGILSAGIKLLASAAFVVAGFGTTGAIGGLVAAQIVAFFYARHYAHKLGLTGAGGKLFRKPDLALIRPQLNYAVLVLIVSLVTTTLFSFDIVVVKHYFSAEVAGAYAGIATIARIIFFLTGSVAGVLLSTIKREAPRSASRALLLRSALLQTILGGAALAVFALAPLLVTRLLIGPRYLSLAGLLPELSLAMFVIAFVNLMLIYDLALRRWSGAVVAIAGAVVTFALVLVSHANPAAVVRSLLLGSCFMLALRALDTVRRRLTGL